MHAPPVEFTSTAAQIGPDEYVLTLGGEVDLYTAPRLSDAADALFAEGAKTLVLDLRSVTLLDSAALGTVTAAAKRARQAGGELVLACDSREVLRVFQVTGFDRFVTIRPSFTDVLAELRGRPA